jgi:uncharacterized protein YndB with AHSA1/START domain
MKKESEVRREVELPGPPEDVWPALADPDRLAEWFGARADGEFAPGGSVEFRWPDGSRRAASIEDFEPPRRLAFRWAPFDRALDGRTRRRRPTRVAFDLEPEGDHTKLVVVERALETVAS